jgi:hypothetical protein
MRGSSAGRAEDEDATRDIVEDLTEAPSPDRRSRCVRPRLKSPARG